MRNPVFEVFDTNPAVEPQKMNRVDILDLVSRGIVVIVLSMW